ncbi:MAG: hypothetical protein KKB25_01400 [Nanoarchaeota archaeon]|nr:hypothetical protein [Nanoarchaeota archaeon]
MNKTADRITELMNEARAGKISAGEFVKKAEKFYGVNLPELKQDLLSDAADFHYSMKKSGLSFREYAERVLNILDCLQILDEENANERYAQVHGLSGKLTI